MPNTATATKNAETHSAGPLVEHPTGAEIVAFCLDAPLEEMPHHVLVAHDVELWERVGWLADEGGVELELGGEG